MKNFQGFSQFLLPNAIMIRFYFAAATNPFTLFLSKLNIINSLVYIIISARDEFHSETPSQLIIVSTRNYYQQKIHFIPGRG